MVLRNWLNWGKVRAKGVALKKTSVLPAGDGMESRERLPTKGPAAEPW